MGVVWVCCLVFGLSWMPSAFAQEEKDSTFSVGGLLFGVGWAREASGDPEAAIDSYRQAAQGRTETAARAQFQIGECLFALGRHEEATSEFIKVDILFSSPMWSAAALYEAGRCFDALGDREQASQQWRRVIKIDTGGKWTEMARARLGDTDQPVLTSEQQQDFDTNSID